MTLRLSHSHGANFTNTATTKIAIAGERNVISSGSLSFQVNPVLKTRHKVSPSKVNAAAKKIPELHLNPVSEMRQTHNAIVANATTANGSNFHQAWDL